METIKIPKISQICSKDELMELLNYVLITKTDVVATDEQALVMHPVCELFSDEFHNIMQLKLLSKILV